MSRDVWCAACRKSHTLPSYDGEKVTPARVVWESIAFLFIVLAIIYGGSAVSFWLATRPQ
jgi:hypothetical protein